jgi:hypothetical protein
MAAVYGEALRHLLNVAHDAFVFRSCHAIFTRPLKCDFRAQAGDGEANAAEPAAESAVEIEETQVQSRRYRHGYAVWHRVGGAPQKAFSSAFNRRLIGLLQKEYQLTMCHPDRVGNLDTRSGHATHLTGGP